MKEQSAKISYICLIFTIVFALFIEVYQILRSHSHFLIAILTLKTASDLTTMVLSVYLLGKNGKANFFRNSILFNKILTILILIMNWDFIYILLYVADSNFIRKIIEQKNIYFILHSLALILATFLNTVFINQDYYDVKFFVCIQYAIPQLIYCLKNRFASKKDKEEKLKDNKFQINNLLMDEIKVRESSPQSEEFYPHLNISPQNMIESFLENDESQGLNFKQNNQVINEKIWKKRLNGIPIGLMLVHLKKFKIAYYNKCIFKMMKRLNFCMNNQFESNVMNNINFKIMDTSEFNQQKSQLMSNNSIQPIMNNNDSRNPFTQRLNMELKQFSKKCMNNLFIYDLNLASIVKFIDEDKIYKEQSLMSIIQMIRIGELDDYFDNDDGALELYSQFFIEELNKQVYLNCRIIKNKDQFDDKLITIIIQDYSRQNLLQIKDEQNQFKTKVISSFSHELRTPLNSAILFLKSSILDSAMNHEFKQKYILPSLSSLAMQNLLINDIIDFCQINTNQIELRLQTFTINNLIQDITEIFQHELKMKGLGLAFQIHHSVENKLKTDYQRLIQILTNLIGNAQKFSEQGYILIKVEQNFKQELLFQVQDEGIGINPGDLRQIQEVLKQQYNEISINWNGKRTQSIILGLGLLISQMLVRLLKFDNEELLDIRSSGFMQGTTVNFTISNREKLQFIQTNSLSFSKKLQRQSSLPNMKEEHGLIIAIKCSSSSKLLFSLKEKQDEDQEQNSLQEFKPNLQKKSDKKHLLSQLNKKFKPKLSLKSNKNPKCRCKKIFAVDDEVFNLTSLQLLTSKKTKYTVDIAFNGKQAIDKLLKAEKCSETCTPYKLILMDCSMPIMDGWEATENLKKLMKKGKMATIPIIGLTAFTSSQDIQKCLKSGMEQVLHKPVQIDRLCQILED